MKIKTTVEKSVIQPLFKEKYSNYYLRINVLRRLISSELLLLTKLQDKQSINKPPK